VGKARACIIPQHANERGRGGEGNLPLRSRRARPSAPPHSLRLWSPLDFLELAQQLVGGAPLQRPATPRVDHDRARVHLHLSFAKEGLGDLLEPGVVGIRSFLGLSSRLPSAKVSRGR